MKSNGGSAPSSGGQFDSKLLDYWYRNDQKVESLFAQLNGRIETERKETVSKGSQRSGNLGIEIGSILAFLGLGKGNAEATLQTTNDKILEITSALSIENKAAVLMTYLRRSGELGAVALFGGERSGVTQGVKRHRFSVISGGFVYIEDEKRPELQSALRADDGRALVRVPLLNDHHLLNQAVNALSEEDIFPHEVFCQCLIRPGWILANPIAIWFPYPTEDSEELQWSDGTSTSLLDPETGIAQ